jgi:hypothetical protein
MGLAGASVIAGRIVLGAVRTYGDVAAALDERRA